LECGSASYRFDLASLLAALVPNCGTPLDGELAGLSESGSKTSKDTGVLRLTDADIEDSPCLTSSGEIKP